MNEINKMLTNWKKNKMSGLNSEIRFIITMYALTTDLWGTRGERGHLLGSYVTHVLPPARLDMSK